MSSFAYSNKHETLVTSRKEVLNNVARFIGKHAVDIVASEPHSLQDLISYYSQIYLQTSSRNNSQFGNNAAKIAMFSIFALYQLSPWEGTSNKKFRSWCDQHQMPSKETAFALSAVREFEGWEPASPEDYGFVIMLDRAIIRGARVGASALKPGDFIVWFQRNFEMFEGGANLLESAQTAFQKLSSEGISGEEKFYLKKEVERVARIVLREIGFKYGRSGLNSVRRQIGAPPAARRPSHLALGARYSQAVYRLSQEYVSLGSSEREAFKSLLNKLDSGVPLGGASLEIKKN